MSPHVPPTRRFGACVAFICAVVGAAIAEGATLGQIEAAWRRGEYEQVARDAAAAARSESQPTEWILHQVRALLTLGRNAEADRVMKEALVRDTGSIRLRWLARDVAYANNRPDDADTYTTEIRRLASLRPWAYRNADDLVVFGRAALLIGADPKDVLEKVYSVAQSANAKAVAVYRARGELALEKQDYALAAKAFDEGLKIDAEDPDLLCGRAEAYSGSDREAASDALQTALKTNPRHIPSLLQLVDRDIDAEAYNEANALIDSILAINPLHPDAWAYRAVIAHLRNDAAGEATARNKALSTWQGNPRVDFIVGRKLAQKYRFAEAAASQRRSLNLAPGYLPASAELATDLLRLGEEAEGWQLAQAIHERDEYNVEAYNLVTLRDTMNKYATLNSGDFVVRMASSEVAVYGPRVLGLLRDAKEKLTRKYGVELAAPTYIEIFADQRDFAVRTFGLPDIPGFLGVCFGRVVTANSPAANTSPINWQSVLWHEFCHAVTLQFTRNRMPRWLSEGISVYEERQASPSWGMQLTPQYRDMIMGDDLVPVGKLSGAFLSPKTSQHLQFAYLESALVIEFIVERHGQDRLRGVLRDLREGVEINAALARNIVPLPELEKQFAAFARERAKAVGAGLNWDKPDPALLEPNALPELAAWSATRPDNYWVLKLRAARAVEDEKWADARPPLERLVRLFPEQKGSESAYRDLVAALRGLGDLAAERAVLEKWASVDDEAPDAYLRLMQLAADTGDWKTVRQNADRYLAVNPLLPAPYRFLAQAAAADGDVSTGVVAWRTLLQLDAPDPTEAHYELAKLLHRRGEHTEAKREVLLALEDTPRFRAALQLLTEINRTVGNARPLVLPGGVAPEMLQPKL